MSANSNDSISPPWLAPVADVPPRARWWRAYRGALKADWAERRRDWRAKLVLMLGVALAVLAATLTALDVKSTMADRAVAEDVEQQRWVGQGKKNAHSAAHYGIYVFKPISALSAIEPGIERYVGATVWLEAHKQNEFVYRPANDKPAAARQLPLTPSFVLQVLAPLAMIFLGFGLFAAERERGTLRALRMTAAPLTAIGTARATTLWLAGVVLALPAVVAVALVSSIVSDASPFIDTATRVAIFAATYAAYLAIWALSIAAVSAWASTTRQALALLVAIWAIWTLVLPRAAVEVAEVIHPLPSAQSFRENMEKALGEPHDPDVEAKYKADILAQYGVKDVKDLPVNWSGISLARGEAHSDSVYDSHYGKLFQQFDAQSRTMSAFGWLSPAIAATASAGASAGSDTTHHLHFVKDAEVHRRLIQKMMNDFITANPDRDGQRIDGNESLWRSVPPFQFRYPAILTTGMPINLMQLVTLLLLAIGIFLWRCRALSKAANP
jgi:ABC-2 type transport system permease protein